MALFNPRLTKTNQFIKSSYKDLQDPVFLTFDVDFFPVSEEFPRGDGLYNSSLLRIPPGSEADQLLASSNTQNPNSFRINGPTEIIRN